MATETKQLLERPGEQLGALFALMGGADTVELKVTLPESRQRSALRALDVDPMEAQIRQVFFFDTPELALSGSGVVVRARRVQGRGGDTVVKLRPVVPEENDARLLLVRAAGRLGAACPVDPRLSARRSPVCQGELCGLCVDLARRRWLRSSN